MWISADMPQFEPRLATTNTTPTPSGRPLTTTFIPLTDTTVSRSVVHPSSSVVSGAVIFSAPVGKHDDCESSDTSSSSDTESGSDREDALRKGEGISKSSPAQHRSTASGKAKKVCRASRTSQAASSSTTSLPPSQSLSSPQPRFPTQSPTPPTLPSTQSTATFFAGITPQSSQESSSTSVDHSATSTGVRSLWSAKSRRTRGTRTTLGSSTTSYPSPSTFYSSSATSSDLGASVPNLPTSPTPIPNPTQPSFVDLAEPGLDAGSAVAISLGVFAGSTLLVVATVVLMLLLLRRRKGCDNCGCRAGSESTAKRPSTSSESTDSSSRLLSSTWSWFGTLPIGPESESDSSEYRHGHTASMHTRGGDLFRGGGLYTKDLEGVPAVGASASGMRPPGMPAPSPDPVHGQPEVADTLAPVS